MLVNLRAILVPVDFSELSMIALDEAVLMARLAKSTLHLLHVIETYSINSSLPSAIRFSKNNASAYEQEATEKLSELKAEIQQRSGLQVITHTASGRIYKSILTAAEENNVDLVVMGTSGETRLQGLAMGSNASLVIANANCPVITYRSKPSLLGFKKIILPLDLTVETKQKVQMAIDIAQRFEAKIEVLSIVATSDESIRTKLQRQLDQVTEVLKGQGVDAIGVSIFGDDVVNGIIEYANQNGDLLMIMTQSESETSYPFLSSKAQKIVNQSTVPVFSMRPKQLGVLQSVSL